MGGSGSVSTARYNPHRHAAAGRDDADGRVPGHGDAALPVVAAR